MRIWLCAAAIHAVGVPPADGDDRGHGQLLPLPRHDLGGSTVRGWTDELGGLSLLRREPRALVITCMSTWGGGD